MIEYRANRRFHNIGGARVHQHLPLAAATGSPGTTNLIAWWTLDETSGTRADSHGLNDLADVNTVLYATGKKSNAADFEFDTSEYLWIADNTDLSMGDIDFTLGAWVKFETTGPRTIMGKWDIGAATNQREYVLVAEAGQMGLWVSSTGAAATVVKATAATPSDGAWHFLVGWHDATANKIYYQLDNGTPVETATSAGVLNGTAPFVMGDLMNNGSPFAGYYMDGLIDEAFIYKRVLTADERTWLFNSGNGRTYTDL